MIIDFTSVLSGLDRAFSLVRNPTHVALAEKLAKAEEQYEVAEPLGEWPDVPPYVPAGVEPSPQGSTGGYPNLDVVAGIIDRQYATYRTGMKRAPLSAWCCQCGQLFTLRLEHSEHVADLLLNST